MSGLKIKPKYVAIDTELTVTLSAYTAGDVVGGLLTFAVGSATGGGIINGLSLVDEDDQSEAYTLWLFDAVPTTIANDAAFAPTIADLRKKILKITIAAVDYTTTNSLAEMEIEDIDRVFSTADGNLYGYLVATATPDYANVDTLFLRLFITTEGS